MALDLYFRVEFKDMEPTGEGVMELSELLNALPGQNRKANEKFRNPNGVSMKLQNFKAFDDRYEGLDAEHSCLLQVDCNLPHGLGIDS